MEVCESREIGMFKICKKDIFSGKIVLPFIQRAIGLQKEEILRDQTPDGMITEV
jgi:hypothetical protein